jgi:hypothetical protein
MKMMKMLCMVVMLAALAGCDAIDDKKKSSVVKGEDLQNLALAAQGKAQEAMANGQVEHQKLVVQIELDVARKCVDHGNIPIFVNGNVDCKPAPK